MNPPVMTTSLAGLGPRHQGKVRDIYDLGDKLLLVATDRISAFDVVMAEPIPDKGRILTQLSAFWFRHLADLTPNHLVSLKVEEFPPACRPFQDLLAGRTMLVRKCKPLPVECIVRGYLSGSGWAEYREDRRHRRFGPAPGAGGVPEAAGAHLYPLHQGRAGDPRRKHLLCRHGEPDRGGAGGAGQGPEPGHLPPGPGLGRAPGHHHRGHQVRVRPGRWR